MTIAIADHHLLEKKHKEHFALAAEGSRKAGLVVKKEQRRFGSSRSRSVRSVRMSSPPDWLCRLKIRSAADDLRDLENTGRVKALLNEIKGRHAVN